MTTNWKKLGAAAGICLGLIGLLLLVAHPAAVTALVAAFVLLPVVLFGIVAVPRSLWPALDLEAAFTAPIPVRARLFERPPPVSIL